MSTFLSEVKGFTPVIDIMVKEIGLMPALIYGRVWRFCRMEDGVCTASLDTIAGYIGVSRKTVERHIKTLCDGGYLRDMTPDRRHKPHEYADTGKAKIMGLIAATGETESPTPEIGKTESPTKSGPRSDTKSDLGKTESPIKIPSEDSMGKKETSSAPSADEKPNGLLPDTKKSRMMFGRLQASARAEGKRGPGKFRTLEQKQKFDEAAAQLTEQEFERSLTAGLQQGINSVARMTNWVAKWDGNRQKGAPHGSHQRNRIAPGAVERQVATAEEARAILGDRYGGP